MKACIGIISYFPDEEDVRQVRVERLKTLLKKCRFTFNLPIIIIAQNWKDEIPEEDDMTVIRCDKLGITGARKTLRNIFISKYYDYMICLDDDFELNSNKLDGNNYLNFLTEHPDCIIEYENYLMNLLAISKSVAIKFDYDNISAEDGTGFEDWIYISKIRTAKPGLYLRLTNLSLATKKRSDLVNDKYSTWQNAEGVDKDDISKKSWKIITDYKKLYEKH